MNEETTSYGTCTKYYSLENGEHAGLEGEHTFEKSHFCLSGQALLDKNTETYKCMPADISEQDRLFTPVGDEKCSYKRFTDPSDFTKFKIVTEDSHCGFNENGDHFCD